MGLDGKSTKKFRKYLREKVKKNNRTFEYRRNEKRDAGIRTTNAGR